MATKKDLIEAQGFSRRRLLTAFTSGAPGGKELDPAKPLRAVVASIALTAMLILGGVFYGLIRPGLPNGWENNTLVLVKDTGARYVSMAGVLYPVINTASARLLMPAGDFTVVTTDQSTLDGLEIGPTIGILGAPDALPAPASLVNDGWSSCAIDDGQTAVAISTKPIATAQDNAVVVQSEDRLYVVVAEHRYEVQDAESEAVLRALGLNAASAIEVDGRWLNLFDSGATLEPLIIAKAGDEIAGTDLAIGSVVHPQGSDDDNRYLLTEDGELAALSPLAYQLYLLGSGAVLGTEREVSPSELATIATAAEPAGGPDWPTYIVPALADGATPCAVLAHDDAGRPITTLATPRTAGELDATDGGVSVSVGSGALVRVGGTAGTDSGLLYLIDESGTAFPVPGADSDIIGRLGFAGKDVAAVPQSWIQFLPVGPELTVEAAGTTPAAASGTGNE